jgi:hypothetical protein
VLYCCNLYKQTNVIVSGRAANDAFTSGIKQEASTNKKKKLEIRFCKPDLLNLEVRLQIPATI